MFPNASKIASLFDARERSSWEIADLIADGQSKGGSVAVLSDEIHGLIGRTYNESYLQHLGTTAKSFPKKLRNSTLTFSHYSEAVKATANQAERDKMIAIAAKGRNGKPLSKRAMLIEAGRPKDELNPAKVTLAQVEKIVAAKPGLVAAVVAKNEKAADAFYDTMADKHQQARVESLQEKQPSLHDEPDEPYVAPEHETPDMLLDMELELLSSTSKRALTTARAIEKIAATGSPHLQANLATIRAAESALRRAHESVLASIGALTDA